MRKSGCTSIKFAMAKLRRPEFSLERSQDIHLPHPDEVMAHEFARQGWYVFTVVREPITRFLSFYCNKILDQNINGNPTIADRREFGFATNMSLDRAIDSLVDPMFDCDPHAVPQSDVLNHAGTELDYIGRLENLSECVATIEQETGARLPLQHLNQKRSSYPLISEQQFDRLAEFYKNDIDQFGYPSNFSDWYAQFVDPFPESYCSEMGFEFEDEAKLLDYSVNLRNGHYTIELHWRIAPTQTRDRHIRIIRNTELGRRELFHLRANKDMRSECDENMEFRETLVFKQDRLPACISSNDLYIEVYFWSKEQRTKANIVGLEGWKKLLIAFP